MNINVKIDGLNHDGDGIAHLNGKVIFIPNTLPEEEVEINILKEGKNYSLGEVIKYTKISKKRIEPICPLFNKCGGCTHLNVNYNEELKIKKEKIKNIFSKFSKTTIEPEIIISNKEYNYRNKVTLKIKDGKWGYYNNLSHVHCEIKECFLAKESINNVIKNKNLFNINNGEIIIRSNYNDEIIIKIISNDNIKIDIETLSNNIKLLGVIYNEKIIYGTDEFIEIVHNVFYKVNINSFFQINLDVLSKVFDILNQENYGNVIDLYCGVGTLGLGINKNKLYGIEIVPEAIKNALINNKMNKQDNLYILGDATKIKEINDKIDTIIIDPPRSGLNKPTLESILKKDVNKIIYMSCNPITLSRDYNLLKENYSIFHMYLLDMFPKTKHIETICILQKKDKHEYKY